MPRIMGENLVLREFWQEDLACIREWVCDSEITRFLSDTFLYPHSVNQTENFLNAILEGKSETNKVFVIAQKNTLEYIGQIGLHQIDWKNKVATLGIVIGFKDKLGRGIGTEAIALMQYFAFYHMNLNKIELDVHDFNQRAFNCYKKCGFVEEGRLRQHYYLNGKYRDTVRMGILKEEYEAIDSKIRDFNKQMFL